MPDQLMHYVDEEESSPSILRSFGQGEPKQKKLVVSCAYKEGGEEV